MALKISAVIITYNEERIIGKCLEAVSKVSEDIIVIDSYSSDNTPEICRKFGVRFFQKEWSGYTDAKNYGNSLARHDMILSIDADEIVSDELAESLLKIENPNKVYLLDLIMVFDQKLIKHGRFYPDYKLRLFNRKQACWSGEFVHETLEFKPKMPPTEKLKGYLYHYSYPSLEKYIEKINHYSSLHARKVTYNGKRSKSLWKAIFSASFAFISSYFFRLGFLDGRHGFVLAAIDSFYHFLKHTKTFIK
jgi:glycosyltransferase involved in cell wall biosynthesis